MTASLDLRLDPATTDAAPWTDPSRYWPALTRATADGRAGRLGCGRGHLGHVRLLSERGFSR